MSWHARGQNLKSIPEPYDNRSSCRLRRMPPDRASKAPKHRDLILLRARPGLFI